MSLNAFIRQLVALAGVWALCEMLMPEGRQQQMVRLVISLMVMAALIASLGKLLGAVQAVPSFAPAVSAQTQPVGGYQRLALASLANQAENLCLRTAEKAGYQARAAVYLRMDGSLERVELYLARGQEPPLLDENALAQAAAQLLKAQPQQVVWAPLEGGMPP